ncbi:MAG: hypothetical protein ACOYLE_01575 [Bacteroidales bacterium]
MSNIKTSKSINTINNIHVSNEVIFIDFLNSNYKSIGALKYLGAFIDNIRIKNDIGIKAKLQFLIVEREEKSAESSGDNLKRIEGGNSDIFNFSYDLPLHFNQKQSYKEKIIIDSSVVTYSCDPKTGCSVCNSSGKCQKCHGNGYNKCNTCNGRKSISTYVSTDAKGVKIYKDEICSSCIGEGRLSCNNCNNGNCKNCLGSGYIECSRCEGTGYYQKYNYFNSEIKQETYDFYHSEFLELNIALSKTENKIVYDDDVIEWVSKSAILFDNTDKAINANKFSKIFIKTSNSLAKLKQNQKLGRISAVIETIPITIVDYTFESKDYQLFIIGENNIVCYNDIPRKHNFKANIFRRFINLFNIKKRKIAFVYIASYMFNSDGIIDDKELKLLELFIKNIKLNQKENNNLIQSLKQNFSLQKIIPFIKIIKSDKRALIFAWQCALQNNEVNQNEINAFIELSKIFKVKEEDLVNFKKKATKFAKLNDVAMLEEYFKS